MRSKRADPGTLRGLLKTTENSRSRTLENGPVIEGNAYPSLERWLAGGLELLVQRGSLLAQHGGLDVVEVEERLENVQGPLSLIRFDRQDRSEERRVGKECGSGWRRDAVRDNK